MKSQMSRVLSVGIAMAAAAALYAQDKSVTANVPFSFYMGATQMPQGAYRVDKASNGTVVWMNSTQGGAIKAVTANRIVGRTGNEPARLVFHCYAESCFLAEVWADEAHGSALASSKRERELAHNGLAPRLAVIRIASHQ